MIQRDRRKKNLILFSSQRQWILSTTKLPHSQQLQKAAAPQKATWLWNGTGGKGYSRLRFSSLVLSPWKAESTKDKACYLHTYTLVHILCAFTHTHVTFSTTSWLSKGAALLPPSMFLWCLPSDLWLGTVLRALPTGGQPQGCIGLFILTAHLWVKATALQC